MTTPAHAAKCACTPPTEEAKAVGWWNDAPPDAVPKPHATSAAPGDGDGSGSGGVDSDALTRKLAMNEEDLKALLDKNAA